MRVWTGKCRMPIGACSEFRDKECPKFCYYNTVETEKTGIINKISQMTDNGCSITFTNTIHGNICINVKKDSFNLVQWVSREDSEEIFEACLNNLEKEIARREIALDLLVEAFKKDMEDNKCQQKKPMNCKKECLQNS